MPGYSSAAVTSAETTLLAADKPILIGAAALDGSVVIEWSTTGTFGSDATATVAPTSFLHDRRTFQSYPTSAQTTWYVVCQLATTAPDIDVIAYMVHNLNDSAATISIEIANSADFATDLVEIWTDTPSDNGRVMGLLSTRYSDVIYIRAKIVGSSAVPKLGELWFGRRRQLPRHPNRPYDDAATRSSQEVSVANSGNSNGYTFYRGQASLSADLNPASEPYVSDLTLFNAETLHGTQPFLWLPKPSSAANSFYMMRKSPDFDYPYVGTNERQLTIDALEQGPDFLSTEL